MGSASDFKTVVAPHVGEGFGADFSLSTVPAQLSFGEIVELKTDIKIAWSGPLPPAGQSPHGGAGAGWGEGALRVVFECEGPELGIEPASELLAPSLAPLEEVRILIDPVGDQESYFEIGANISGAAVGAVRRRSRVGFKINNAWRCSGLELKVEPLSLHAAPGGVGRTGWLAAFAIPFASVSTELISPPDTWLVNFKRIAPRGNRSDFVQRLHFAKLHFAELTTP